MKQPPQGIEGFLLRKRTVFNGRWIRHGGHYPSYHLRLFRKSRGSCENRLYDQHFVVRGTLAKLEHDYIDVVAADLLTWTSRHVRWADLEAQELLDGSVRSLSVKANLLGSPIERKRWMREKVYGRGPLFVRPFLYFLYRYIFKLGFLDGGPGLVFHFLQGCWFRFLIDARILELRSSRNGT
jgi:hypothetical protein